MTLSKPQDNLSSFPFYRFGGTHFEIGYQFGSVCHDLVRRHYELAISRIQSYVSVSITQIVDAALLYRPYVLRYAPFLDEEIQGIAKGADLSLGEAYFLQLRAEVTSPGCPILQLDLDNECTTFALLSDATADHYPIGGQNADLPEFYREIAVVMEIVHENEPTVLMLTPAGQVSYIGMNNRGLCTFANYLNCDDWGLGFPRYLLTRLALTQDSVEKAYALLQKIERASSRNILIFDIHNNAIDMETTAHKFAPLVPQDGILLHTNHYLTEELLGEERSSSLSLTNSNTRLARIRELVLSRYGNLNVPIMQSILRDRENLPHAICRMPGDSPLDYITFASVIAEPARGQMWVAIGPPNQYPYRCYSFSHEGSRIDRSLKTNLFPV